MKYLLLLLPVFLWLQACSQSPTSGAPNQSASASADTLLGSSANNEFRLFKTVRQVGGQNETELKIVRLQDGHQVSVAKTRSTPKFYWSKNSEFLICEGSVADSVNQRDVIVFDLTKLNFAKQTPGTLMAFDAANDVVFIYRTTLERQIIGFIDIKNPRYESIREIIAPPIGKLPILTPVPAKRELKVKAYTTDDTPMNTAFKY